MAPISDAIIRKIFFYRLANKQKILPQLMSDIRQIDTWPFDDNGRYLVDRLLDERLVIWPDSTEFPIKIRLEKQDYQAYRQEKGRRTHSISVGNQ